MKKIFLLLVAVLLFSHACSAQNNDTELKQKIAQMLVVGFRSTTLTPANHIYNDIKKLNIGGVILFEYDVPSQSRPRNISSPAQVKKLIDDLQAIAPTPLFISIDQEGGKVNRLRNSYGFPVTVSAKYQGKTDHEDTTARYAKETAGTLINAGFNLNFAPCVDVDVNPACPVIGKLERSFSADPQQVVKHAGIWIREQQAQGIIACPKHFPGHGSATGDTHLGVVDVSNTWSEKELIPYRYFIENNMADIIMTSHVYNAHIDAEFPATLSKTTLTGILRKQLHFGGVIVSDDLAMGAIADHYKLEVALEKAINAGVDMLCLSNNGKTYDSHLAERAINTIFTLVKSGKISPETIDASYNRIKALKEKYNIIPCSNIAP